MEQENCEMKPGPSPSSVFMKEMSTLPLMQAATDVYNSTKNSSSVLHTGLALMEYSLGSLAHTFCSGSVIARRVDHLAGEGICRLKEKYETLQQSPEEIKDRTYDRVRARVRTAMKTTPGRILIGGLDWVIGSGDGLLKTLKPRVKSPKKKTVHTRATFQEDAGFVEASSEDSSRCRVRDAAQDDQQTSLTSDRMFLRNKLDLMLDDGMMMKAYKLAVVRPLERLLRAMKSGRRYMAGKYKRLPLTPEKKREIENRRKLSPKKKKLPLSLFGRMTKGAYRLLGYSPMKVLFLGEDFDGLSQSEAEKKRKHEEIESDEATSGEEDPDIKNFDFDNYESEDDPDYEPSDSEESSDEGSLSDDLEDEVTLVEAAPTTDTQAQAMLPTDNKPFTTGTQATAEALRVVEERLDQANQSPIKKDQEMQFL